MDSMKQRKGYTRVWLVLGLLLALPFTLGPSGVTVNEAACKEADGTCCPEWQSICNIGAGDNANYYAKLQGGSCH